ncbi:response regulator transcription factor [Methyloraptor flagellatus]|uniref:Cell cycle response regulator CtrA n=1 Tax=Methyloraptor flagellatus TaxID=3162530 RepID=A0AAU7X5P9_9HYPH
MGPEIIVVEDDPDMCSVIERGLGQGLGRVQGFQTAAEALAASAKGEPKAFLIDVVLPDLDGFTLCRRLRERGFGGAIIFVSGRSGAQDRSRGIDAGADDYVVKPFTLGELEDRVRDQLGRKDRAQAAPGTMSGRSGIVLDVALQIARWQDRTVVLTARETLLLAALLRFGPDRFVTREELYAEVWGEETGGALNAVDVYLGYLRTKLARLVPGGQTLIQTLRGRGFRLRDAVAGSRLSKSAH